MMLPNFLLIGTQKAGSTSLHHYLGQHPEIYVSPLKEPHFFLDEQLERWQYYPGQRIRLWHDRVTTEEEYLRLFQGAAGKRAVGESSVWYLYCPVAAVRIRARLPEAKLIAILRNPVERCFSDFKQGLTLGYEKTCSFLEAVQDDLRRLEGREGTAAHYVPQGFYYAQVRRYFDFFGPERVRVYLYEDLQSRPLELLQDAYRFLGVDASFRPDLTAKKNVSPAVYEVLEPVHEAAGLFPFRRVIIPERQTAAEEHWGASRRTVWQWMALIANRCERTLRHEPSGPFLERVLARLMQKAGLMRTATFQPILEAGARAWLVAVYRDDILRTEKLIKRDLTAWLRC